MSAAKLSLECESAFPWAPSETKVCLLKFKNICKGKDAADCYDTSLALQTPVLLVVSAMSLKSVRGNLGTVQRSFVLAWLWSSGPFIKSIFSASRARATFCDILGVMKGVLLRLWVRPSGLVFACVCVFSVARNNFQFVRESKKTNLSQNFTVLCASFRCLVTMFRMCCTLPVLIPNSIRATWSVVAFRSLLYGVL